MPKAREETEPCSAAFWVRAESTKSQHGRSRQRQPQRPHLPGQEGYLGHISDGQWEGITLWETTTLFQSPLRPYVEHSIM